MIGPNGAGKTTLLAAIMGLLPFAWAISSSRRASEPASVEERVANGLCLVPERRELFAEMTVADNLELGVSAAIGARSRRSAKRGRGLPAIFPGSPSGARSLPGTLSGGERQMLALGRALMAKPRLLMLDEPSLGLAPLIVKEIFSIIAALKASGVSILLVEQNARAALQVSDYGYVLETGTVAIAGPSETISRDPRVAATYLGRTPDSNTVPTARDGPCAGSRAPDNAGIRRFLE